MNTNSIAMLAACVLVAGALPMAAAQDPAVVAPDFYKCTFENEHARLCEVTFKPGATIPSHSHPQHLVYAVTPGKIRITAVGAEPADVEVTAGQVMWLPAETHHGTNTGSSDLKLLVVEFKEVQAAAKAMPKADAATAKDKAEEADRGDAGRD